MPPPELAEAAASFTHPLVTRAGLTTTVDGRWALMVRVKEGTTTPVPEVEQASQGHPVIYDVEPRDWPVARPAYPGRGE